MHVNAALPLAGALNEPRAGVNSEEHGELNPLGSDIGMSLTTIMVELLFFFLSS